MVPQHRSEDLSAREARESRDRRIFARGYLLGNAFELWIAIAAIFAATAFFADPEALRDTSVGKVLHPFDTAWNLGYLLGGLMIVGGLVRPSPRFELAGLSLLSSAVVINGIAVLAVAGSRGASAIFTYFGLAAASATRAYLVIRLNRSWGWV